MSSTFSERVLEQTKAGDKLWAIINKLEPIHQMDRLALFHKIQPLFHEIANSVEHKEQK